MPDNNRVDLAKYRLEMSDEHYKSAKSLSQAFQIRNNADYQDFFVVSKKDAEEQLERAEEFIKALKSIMEI